MNTTFPARRIHLREHAAQLYGVMFRLEAGIELDEGLRHLIRVRASQINGCAFCLDMHWKDARAGASGKSGSIRSTSGGTAPCTASASAPPWSSARRSRW
jgi:AhpD family alkylhydroperoxidase